MSNNSELAKVFAPIIEKGVQMQIDTIIKEIKSVNSPEYLDINQAAEFLRLEVNTIYQKVSKKRIPVKRIGKKLIFLKSDLISWIENQNKV